MTEQPQDQVTPHAARCVLDVAGEAHANYASGFTRSLVQCIFKADDGNQAKLALGFPAFVLAVRLYKHDVLGVKKLHDIAKRDRVKV